VPLFPRILPSLQPVANAADEESILDPNCRRLVPQALSVCALKANLRLGSNALAAIGRRAAADMIRYARMARPWRAQVKPAPKTPPDATSRTKRPT